MNIQISIFGIALIVLFYMGYFAILISIWIWLSPSPIFA